MRDVLETFTDDETGCKVEIVYDQSPDSPRDWDNIFALCLKSRDYTVVEDDIQPYIDAAGETIEQRIDKIEWLMGEAIDTIDDTIVNLNIERSGLQVLMKDGHTYPRHPTLAEVEAEYGGRIFPVYAYIHSGIALSTGRSGQFGDAWDSGQLGFALVKDEWIQREFRDYYPSGRWVYADNVGDPVVDHGDENDWLLETLKGELSALEDYWMGRVYCIDVTMPDGEMCVYCDGGCGIYDDDAWSPDGYLQTSAKAILADAVGYYRQGNADGMLALDLFNEVALV